ncbi:MAG: helix-turn-helix domain-containing protein [Hyphomicrobiaceae bacterium]
MNPLQQYAGQRLRERRRERELTIEQLAEASDLSFKTIVNLEAGLLTMNIHHVCKLARALNIDTHYLVEGFDAEAELAKSLANGSLADWLQSQLSRGLRDQ